MKTLLPGAVLIFAGILLFWASTRRTLSTTARGFLEGQASIAVPAGLAALAYAAGRKNGNGAAGGGPHPRTKMEEPNGAEGG